MQEPKVTIDTINIKIIKISNKWEYINKNFFEGDILMVKDIV
jgi:hypothetical protein